MAYPARSRYEFGRVQVLDGQTSISLNTFPKHAGVINDGSGRLRLHSFGDTLPESISLVMDVYKYEDSDFRLQLPAEANAAFKQDIPKISFEIAGEARRFDSDILSPLRVELHSLQSDSFSWLSAGEHGFMFPEPNVSNRDIENKSTVAWTIAGTDLFSKLEYSDSMATHPADHGDSIENGHAAARTAVLDLPLSGVQSTNVKFSLKSGE